MAIVFRYWNPGEYIQKIVISFLTAPLDEMNYGVRHVKLSKIQNRHFAGVLQDRIFQEIAKFTGIHLCLSLFYNNVASELRQKFMSNCSYRTITGDGFWKWKSFFPSKLIIKVKPIDSHWFKMSCLTCLIFGCIYCFYLKRWNYIKTFVVNE